MDDINSYDASADGLAWVILGAAVWVSYALMDHGVEALVSLWGVLSV